MENILDKIDLKVLGRSLKIARKSLSITQSEVAELIGKPRTTIVAIENGERKIKATELIKIAELYNKSLHHFLNTSTEIEPFWPKFQKEIRRIQKLKLKRAKVIE